MTFANPCPQRNTKSDHLVSCPATTANDNEDEDEDDGEVQPGDLTAATEGDEEDADEDDEDEDDEEDEEAQGSTKKAAEAK